MLFIACERSDGDGGQQDQVELDTAFTQHLQVRQPVIDPLDPLGDVEPLSVRSEFGGGFGGHDHRLASTAP